MVGQASARMNLQRLKKQDLIPGCQWRALVIPAALEFERWAFLEKREFVGFLSFPLLGPKRVQESQRHLPLLMTCANMHRHNV